MIIQVNNNSQSQVDLSYSFEYDCVAADKKNQEVLMMASLRAPEFIPEGKQERASLDIVCVIDKSGSMSGSKIDLVRKTLTFMVDQLRPKDRIALVEFDTYVNTPLQLTRLDSDDRRVAAKSAIAGLHEGSCTNLSGGLFEGYDVLKRRAESNEVASILLFTDGHANEGITSTDRIVEGVTNIIKGMELKPSLFTFGFGDDHNATMLTSISEAGNGMYYYVKNEEAIPDAFGDALGGLVSVVAQNVKLSMEVVDSGGKLVKVLSTLRDMELDLHGKFMRANLGDIFSEESKDIVVNVSLPQCTPTDTVDVVRVNLEYFSIIDNNFHKHTAIAKISRPQNVPVDQKPNMELDKQRNRLLSADALLLARNLGERGDLDRARANVTEAIDRIRASPSMDDPFCRGLVTDLRLCLDNLVDTRTYQTKGSKMINNYWTSNAYQRSAGADESEAQQVYSSKMRSAMKSRFSALK